MKKRKRLISILAGIMAAVMLLSLILSLIPVPASAASSSEIRKQITALQKEKEAIREKIKEVQKDYQANEDEIADIIARKNVIDQEVQLLTTEVTNINQQISAYNLLIADKQEELDTAQTRYDTLNAENKIRIRAMEEEGALSYWEVLFKANSFADLLDRLNMVDEIAAADARHLRALGEAARTVEIARTDLEAEKAQLEVTRQELKTTEVELEGKRAEADALIQELLQKADDLEALEADFEEQEANFLKEIAAMEDAYIAAKEAEWLAYIATMTQATQPAGSGDGSGGTSTGGTSTPSAPGGGSTGGGWVWPTGSRSITSPFGYRTSPTSGASTYHQGIDIDGNTGDAVWAAKAGVVSFSGWGSAAGNYVTIDHGGGVRSIYMHLSSRAVSAGTVVAAGQYIGAMGSTGVSTGSHLHFGISVNGVYKNPMGYV